MPQIWLTYAELEDHLGLPAGSGRDRAVALRFDRRRCRDGLTRVKLPAAVAGEYLHREAMRFLAPDAAVDRSDPLAVFRRALSIRPIFGDLR